MGKPRVVVVTGASAGIGRAIVAEFARRGDGVGLLARGDTGLSSAAMEVERLGGRALPLPVDVADHAAVDSAAAQVERELGPIDVWVNNAFVVVFAPFTDITPDEFRRVTDVTYLGYVNGTRAALRYMLPRDQGTIIQVGSALAYRGIPLQSAYCGAKHAIQGLQDSLRSELLHQGSRVKVTMVQLPAHNTPQFDWALSHMPRRAQPVPPIFQPEVAARAVVYAADHPSRRERWVGYPTVATLLANRLAPGLLDRYLARSGYQSQLTSEPEDPDRSSNLWEPLDEKADYGAHGRFDQQARAHSYQQWISQHRLSLSAAGLGLAGLLTALARAGGAK